MTIDQVSPQGVRFGRLDVGSALGDAVRGVPKAWRRAWGAMLAFVASAAVLIFAPGVGGWGWLLMATAGLALQGGLLRIALEGADRAPKDLGPWGLQLGRPEARLLGAALLCLLLIAMILSVLGLVLLAGAGMAELDADAIAARDWAAAGEGWKLAVVALAGLATVVIVTALFVRLSLYGPATVARGRMVSLDSLLITRGTAMPLLAGLAATSAPFIVLTWLSAQGVVSGPAGGLVWAAVAAGAQAPLTLGFLAAAYRALDTR